MASNLSRFRVYVKVIIDPWIDHLQDHPMGRNPNTLIHILGALHPRSGVPIRHVLRKLQSSPDLESTGARNKHASAGTRDCFTHPRVLLALTARGILAQSNERR